MEVGTQAMDHLINILQTDRYVAVWSGIYCNDIKNDLCICYKLMCGRNVLFHLRSVNSEMC